MDRKNRAGGAGLNRVMLAIAGLVLIAIVGISYRQWRQYNRTNEAGVASRQIIESVDALQSSLIEAETGQRGFLLTGEAQYLEPYNQALQRIPNELSTLRRQLADGTSESANLAQIENLAGQKLAELRQTIDLRRSQGAAPAMAVVFSDRGKQIMDKIRSLSGQIKTAQTTAQSEGSLAGMAASQTALLVTIAGSFVLLILFGIGFEPFMTRQSDLIERSLVLRYGAAILGTAVAVLLRFAMVPLFSGSHSAVPYITFFPAVLLVTWYGGFRAGAFAILLSTLSSAYFFVAPGGSLREANPGDLVTLFIFIVVSFGIAFTTESQRRAVQRADQAEITERQQRQRFETTLASIGDAVIATDADGRVTFANRIALSLVKWPELEAVGKHLDDVFRIVNEFTRKTVESPVARVLREGNIVGLANHTTLLARDGTETPIDDSAAPIRGAHGVVQGTVLVFRDISDRRKAEATSRLLASIVESSDDAIISKDLSGTVMSWNNGAERIFGYSAAEMIGRPISVLADPDHADEMSAILERIRRGERVHQFHSLRRTKNGELIHASITVSPVRDGEGQITGASKIVRNITVEVQAQKEIAEQRERLQVTLGSIGDAVMATDSSGRVSYLNPVAEQMTGWTSQEASARPLEEVFRIVNEESRRPVENPVTKVLREGRVVGLANHTLLISRDGRETPIDDSAAPIKDALGEIMGVVLIFRNITERREAEEAIRTSEERRDAILKYLPIGVGVIDRDGHLVMGNPAWKKFLRGDLPGIDDEESTRWRATTGEGQPLPRTEYPAMQALRGEDVLPGIDFLHRESDGVERWTRVSAVPLRDASGNITGALTLIQDVEEEKKAEEQRAELLAKDRALAAQNALREVELELARVVRALSVGELATSIAHEINQPLAGVVTNAEAGLRWLSGETPNISEARESLALITRDGNRASAVIRRIREFLRKETPEHASLDLNQVVQGALDIARSELVKRGVVLHLDLHADLPNVRGDRIQLQQVILNLAMNGADAMASIEGPKELFVTSERSTDGFVAIAVRDSGVGISPNDMPRMFDAFFTTKPQGMGLGLSLSRSIIEAHHGRIWAEVKNGPGVTVQFTLQADGIVQPSLAEGEL